MLKKMQPRFVALSIVAILVIAVGVIGVLSNRSVSGVVYDTKPLEDSELEAVYLGDEDADNELLFVSDYSCPACHEWEDLIYPEITSRFIDTGIAKFRTQSMVYLNEDSLTFSNFDQNLKRKHPDLYFELLDEVFLSDRSSPIDEALIDIIDRYGLSHDLMDEPLVDSLNITRTYTRALNVEFVPTIYVNGIKVEDAFDLNEIESYFH